MIKERLLSALSTAVRAVREAGRGSAGAPTLLLDVPPSPELGDFSTDVALQLARESRQAPAAVARALAEQLQPAEGGPLAGLLEGVDVTPSGVLNFRLRADWREAALREARELGARFGTSEPVGERYLIEFVSANPTGPLTVAHGRGAVLGDTLARLLEATGCAVTREFYVNDTEPEAERFGKALEAARGPGAADEHLAQLAARLADDPEVRAAAPAERTAALGRAGMRALLAEQRALLGRLGVRFDEWRSEAELHAAGRTEEALRLLQEAGHTYTSDGAEWLRTTAFGDTADRPLRRGNGQLTYLGGDLGYHLDKFQRGYGHVIDVWGAEHADYVERTQAGLVALGSDPAAVEILIFQPVRVRIDGMLIEGGASSGNNVPLEEVLEKVGPDTARWLYLSRPAGVPLELDLDLGRSPAGPAARVRAAATRARSLAEAARSEGRLPEPEAPLGELTPAADALARVLVRFPDELHAAAREREPARLARYALETADAFTAFESEPAPPDSGSRAALLDAAAIVLSNALAVLGIRPAPQD